MRAHLLAALTLTGLASETAAQTKCDAKGCAYNFKLPQEGYWPDWIEISSPEINYLNVEKGAGFINVQSHGPNTYLDNHAHILWYAVGHSWTNATASVRFTGDNGRSGWIEKLSDGRNDPKNCKPWEHAPRVSDATLILTLYDDVQSFIGVFLGDLLPLGENILPTGADPPTEFGVVGIVQLMPGQSSPQILAYEVGERIKMKGKASELSISVSPDWTVTATGLGAELTAQAQPANIRGSVGLIGVTGARPYCIYRSGGEFSRQFEVSNVYLGLN